MFRILFPFVIFVLVSLVQCHRGYREFNFKKNVDGDFVFPTNEITFPEDSKQEASSWINSFTTIPKYKPKDGTKNFRKSDKKYFEYTGVIFPDDYEGSKVNLTEEAREQDYNGRILADAGEYPHMAAIGFQPEGQDQPSFRCGGSLISKMFVITAAHCTEFNGDKPNFVILGDVDLTRIEDENHSSQRFQVKRIISHPNYNTSFYYYDVALIELDRVIDFTEFVRPIRLWAHEDIPYDTAYAMGYGATEFGGRQTNRLTDLNLTILSNDECNDSMPKTSETPEGIITSQICAIDYQMNRDTCQGDSGGPLQINTVGRRRRRKHYFLIGIISYGIFCRSKNPSVYTRVSSFIDWIENEVWP